MKLLLFYLTPEANAFLGKLAYLRRWGSLLLLICLISGCRSGATNGSNTILQNDLVAQTAAHMRSVNVPVSSIAKQKSVSQELESFQIFYEQQRAVSIKEQNSKSFQSVTAKRAIQKLLWGYEGRQTKRAACEQCCHAAIHIQYPHPEGKLGVALASVKVRRQSPPTLFELERPAPIKKSLHQMNERRPRVRQAKIRAASYTSPDALLTEKVLPQFNEPQHPFDECEIWTLEIPAREAREIWSAINETFPLSLSERRLATPLGLTENSNLFLQTNINPAVQRVCSQSSSLNALIKKVYMEGSLSGFSFE